MAERIKLNKVSLREQKQQLGLYHRFLPALEARKQMFLLQLGEVRKLARAKRRQMEEALGRAGEFSGLLRQMEPLVAAQLRVERVESSGRNFAGLKVPHLDRVVFADQPYGMFETPYAFETVRDMVRALIVTRTELEFLERQEQMLSEGLRKTSQRINLYQQRLMPDCRDAIRRINVYLQDQRAVSVGVAKAAKRLSAVSL
jgi:V/A-type H+-transporting ATPase subunit D